MKLYIPTIGTKLRLTAPWTFEVQNEYRNSKFWESAFGEPCPDIEWVEDEDGFEVEEPVVRSMTLPAGTVLTVDRIYIRKGVGEFDSVTFNLPKKNFPMKISGRFWAKLQDVNRMEVELA